MPSYDYSLNDHRISASEQVFALHKPRSLREAHRITGISPTLLAQHVKSGEIEHISGLGKRPKVTLDAVLRWQRSRARKGVE